MITREDIEAALKCLQEPVSRYLSIQEKVQTVDIYSNQVFRREFNRFYRVRHRSQQWHDDFYTIFSNAKKNPTDFKTVLCQLQAKTGRIEKSFASKLLSTLDPSQPVIDSLVLRHLIRRQLMAKLGKLNIELAVDLHERLRRITQEFLESDGGRGLVEMFERSYPDTHVTKEKMVDFVLWMHERCRLPKGACR